MIILQTLFLLILIHYLCDFALQNDFVAKFKSYRVDNKYNPFWYHCLLAHSAIHALGVYVLTQSIAAALFMIITHFIIDHLKCLNKITLNQDQSLHFLVLTIIAICV